MLNKYDLEKIKQYSLSKNKVNQCIKKGIISENINEIFVKKIDGIYQEASYSNWINYISTLGIRLGFVCDDNYDYLRRSIQFNISN